MEETGNQEGELKNGVGALELYQPESQMSESAPDTSHELHLKSGTINSERILIWGGGGGRIKACSIGGSIPPRNVLHLLLMTSDTLHYIKQFSEGGGSGGGGGGGVK